MPPSSRSAAPPYPPLAVERRNAAAAVKLLKDLTRTMRARMKQIEAAEIREREGRPARVDIDEVLRSTLTDVQAGTEKLRKLAPFLVAPTEAVAPPKRGGRAPRTAASPTPPTLPQATVNREEILALRRFHRTLKRRQTGQAAPAPEIAALMKQLDEFEESYQRAEVWSGLSAVLGQFVETVSEWDRFSRRRVEALLRGQLPAAAVVPGPRVRPPRPKTRR